MVPVTAAEEMILTLQAVKPAAVRQAAVPAAEEVITETPVSKD
jgi:hypothetical protein